MTIVALGWGLLVGSLVLGRGPRLEARLRARALADRRPRGPRRPANSSGLVARVARDARARLGGRRAERTLEAQVPVAVDLLAVAMGSGCSPVAAVEVASRWAPAAVAARFELVYRSFLMGESFASAAVRLGRPQTALGTLGALLAEAGTLGSPMLAPLDRLATESRAAFRRRAEARARTVPVRLLFPLVFLVLPAFGLITVVPAIDAGLRGG